MFKYAQTSENVQPRPRSSEAQVEANITLQEYYLSNLCFTSYYSKHEILEQSLLYELISEIDNLAKYSLQDYYLPRHNHPSACFSAMKLYTSGLHLDGSRMKN